jgi:hypothetical protein
MTDGQHDGLGQRLQRLLANDPPEVRSSDAVLADVQARRARRRRRHAALLASPIVLAVVVVGLLAIASNGGRSTVKTTQPAATGATGSLATTTTSAAASPTTSPQCNVTMPVPPGLPPDKAAALQRLEDQRRQHCNDTPTTARAPSAAATTSTTTPWASGIINAAQYPGYGKTYRITTAWQGVVGTDHVQVFAGAVADSGQGVIVVRRTALDEPNIDNATTTVISGPSGSAMLTLISGTYPTFAATDTNGANYTVDVAKQSVVKN